MTPVPCLNPPSNSPAYLPPTNQENKTGRRLSS
jgi:hypothetical protein